jgi:hypothetical protein
MKAADGESAPERIQINLPALFAQINQHRQAGGLPQVEPAIMAVRSTIKFSIRRGRTLKLRGDAVDAERDDVEALCAVLSDLFNVEVRPADEHDGGQVRVLGLARAPVWALPMSRLYETINQVRGEKGLPAVESAVISVRTRVRYSVVRSKPLNFKEDRLIIDEQDRSFLDDFIASHFNVEIPGGVAALCVDPPTAERRTSPTPQERTAVQPAARPATIEYDRMRDASGHPLQLSLPRLYESINRLRSEKGLAPVEPAVISVRTRVRYSIVRQRPLDFKGERLQVDDADRDFFDVFITQHFDVNIPGGIAALCEAYPQAREPLPVPAPRLLAAPIQRLGEKSTVWRYLSELLRLARYGPLTRVSLEKAAEAITLRMHGQPSEARSRDVRERLGRMLLRDVGVDGSPDDNVFWLSRAQMQDAARLVQHEFSIDVDSLRELLP